MTATIAWTSSDATVAAVSGGTVTALKAGTATITAASGTVQGTSSVTVTAVPVASVAVTPTPDTVLVGQTVQLIATPKDAGGAALSGRPITWTSSDSTLGTVSVTGLVTTRGVGTVTLTASVEGKLGTATVVVRAVPVATVVVSPVTASVYIGQTVQLAAATKDSAGGPLTGRLVTWTSSDTSVADVSTTGLVTAKKVGSVTVTGTSEGKAGAAAVAVGQVPVRSVTITPTLGSLFIGQTAQLTATTRDSAGGILSGRVIAWSVSDTSVATVASTGLVTGRRAGTVTLTATSEGKSALLTLTIAAVPVGAVSVSPVSVALFVGQTTQLSATVKDSAGGSLQGRAVAWTSSDTTVAFVSNTGLVTARASGSVSVTAASGGKSGTSSVTVSAVPVSSVVVTPATASLYPAQSVQLNATVKDSTGAVLTDRTVTWTSSDTSVVVVSAAGLVTSNRPGSATVIATSEGKAGNAAVTVAQVPVRSVTVTPTTARLYVGQTTQLTAVPRDSAGSALQGRTVTWSSSDTAIATVITTGLVTARQPGTATISASSEGKLGTMALTVPSVPVASVAVSPSNANLFVGGTAQLSATTSDSAGSTLNGRTVTWQSSDTTRATVSPAGLVTALAPGTVSISATSENKSASASITVSSVLSIVQGDAQSAQILSPVPVAPSVRLVDAQGNPRAGIVITFTPSSSGSVTATSATTGANGIASAGTWTLGDSSGDQTLTATVGTAHVTFHAQATGTPTFLTATAIGAGFGYSCSLSPSGVVSCWGEATHLGNNSSSNQCRPVSLSGQSYASLDASYTHTCAVTAAGAAWCWGNHALPTPTLDDPLTPTLVTAPEPWSQFVPVFGGNCAIGQSGQTYCWGDNRYGTLGDGTQTTNNNPTLVAGGFAFVQLSADAVSACGLTADGSAYCWGSNNVGQLGDGTNTDRDAPTAVATTLKFRKIAIGAGTTCGVTTSGAIACWGYQLGSTPSLQQVGGNPSFTDVFAGGDTACGLASDGMAYCLGQNTYGELGDGTTSPRYFFSPVAGPLKFSKLDLQSQHSCGITVNQEVACWGRNSFGELGDGTTTDHYTPRRIVMSVAP